MFQCLFDFYVINRTVCRFQWTRCLGRGSTAGIVGSNPAVGVDVCVVSVVQSGQKAKPRQSGQRRTDKVHSCEWCVLSGRGLCNGPIPRPEESHLLWCIIVCDLETWSMRRPWPALGCCVSKKETVQPLFFSRAK